MENQPSKLDKAVKISIIAGVLIVALSIAYYLLIFLPKKEKNRSLDLERQNFESKANACIKLGLQKEEAEKNNAGNGAHGVPEFKFNKKLNTCIYKNFYIDDKYAAQYVIDLTTNKTILDYNKYDNKDLGLSFEEYKRQSEELFRD